MSPKKKKNAPFSTMPSLPPLRPTPPRTPLLPAAASASPAPPGARSHPGRVPPPTGQCRPSLRRQRRAAAGQEDGEALLIMILLETPRARGGAATFADAAAGGFFGGPLRLLGRSTTGVAVVFCCREALTCEEGLRGVMLILRWSGGEPAVGAKEGVTKNGRAGGRGSFRGVRLKMHKTVRPSEERQRDLSGKSAWGMTRICL